MKYLLLSALLFCAAFNGPLSAQTADAPKTDKEKLSYALGMNVGQTLKKQPMDLDQGMFFKALHDGLNGGTLAMTEDQARDTLMAFGKQLQAKRQAEMAAGNDESKAEATKNKAAGDAFLATNKASAGVQTLPDGLQYKVVKDGEGASPTAADTVTVKYRGTLIDGKEFDNSEQHGGTATFPVGGVIHGWTEALQKMKVGSKWQLFIPSSLAYGDQAMGTDIPPGSTLIFDVELVAIGAK